MLLCISTGAVWRCCESRLAAVHLIEEKFGGLIDGVELCFINASKFWGFELDERAIRFLRSKRFVSLHAPCSGIEYGDNRKTRRAFGKIREINKAVALQHVTFHPNHVRDFGALKRLGLRCLVENLSGDEKRKGWQFPQELKRFLEKERWLGFCYDVNHGMSNGVEPKEFLKNLGSRIECIHLNATEKTGEAQHHLLVQSSNAVVEKIRPVLALGKPLVIEPRLQKEELPLIGKEIEFVRKTAESIVL
ncbi:MAG: hypothetical protein NTW59_05130 [Candidatus Diapherotrites archaeon]|nr:hypothetical protein [Candidatus Diapherotrites archaeon]